MSGRSTSRAWGALTSDSRLLFSARVLRLFAYGFLSVILVLYLAQVGLTAEQIGLLLTLALIGDAVISLGITLSADRIGRRRMLVLGALLMLLAGVAFILTSQPLLLMAAALIGVLSPTGNEIGPFLSIEQAALAQLLQPKRRTQAFAWYSLAGSFATATGALSGGLLATYLQSSGLTPLASYRVVLLGYAGSGLVLVALFLRLSSSVETASPARSIQSALGLHRSRNVVLKLSALFALDAFAGAFVVQSIVAYWFYTRFGVQEDVLGGIFFGANILAGFSALLAARIAARIGLVNTMVFTHIPSNVLLCLVPFMPTLPLAIGVLLSRFAISQMDVPTRQSYTLAVVDPDERSAASGVTTIARSVGAALSPSLAGLFLATPALLGAPFLVAGSLKIVYDLLLYRNFKTLKPPEEAVDVRPAQVDVAK
ncbi:MAG TPA: MFS transporter [Anaerolineae bacterium]|nr:MFS transporter [Anaerolineae bacterium]